MSTGEATQERVPSACHSNPSWQEGITVSRHPLRFALYVATIEGYKAGVGTWKPQRLSYTISSRRTNPLRNGRARTYSVSAAAPASAVCERLTRGLVRVDLGVAGRASSRAHRTLRADFLALCPQRGCSELAYEEYRLRKQAGDAVSCEDYRRRYGISKAAWPEERRDLPQPNRDYPSALGLAGSAADRPDTYSFLRAARVMRRLHARPGEEIASALGAGAEAELFRELLSSNPAVAADLAKSALAPPRPGSDFLGFHLLSILGKGAFGQVYLARQGELANRLVALKVTASFIHEPQTLAQLQHPHIVPVYSLHVQAPHQAVCMLPGCDHVRRSAHPARADGCPRIGEFFVPARVPANAATIYPRQCRAWPTTIVSGWGNDVHDAVLWIMQCVAKGCARHERGIVHRDLKPANVLLTDGGAPMLLDFNLAEDLKLRSSLAAAQVGGTLPYMAPESLQALSERREHADARGDLYAVGILLFELLTGRHPFTLPRSRSTDAVKSMIEERRCGAPPLRPWNRAVSPATEAIVRKCLEPDPAQRYAHAWELAEDLRRQREHIPLRFAREPSLRERLGKWVWRHPRLATSASVATAATAIVLVLLGFSRAANAWPSRNTRPWRLSPRPGRAGSTAPVIALRTRAYAE